MLKWGSLASWNQCVQNPIYHCSSQAAFPALFVSLSRWHRCPPVCTIVTPSCFRILFLSLLLLLGNIFVLPLLFTKRFIMESPSSYKSRGSNEPLCTSPSFIVINPQAAFFYLLLPTPHTSMPPDYYCLKKLFVYLLLLSSVFIAARGPSPVGASGGYSSWYPGLSLQRPPLLWSSGSRCMGFSGSTWAQ